MTYLPLAAVEMMFRVALTMNAKSENITSNKRRVHINAALENGKNLEKQNTLNHHTQPHVMVKNKIYNYKLGDGGR